ncbi:MAG: hypothetical protein U5K54_25685 [Cytophagales bacterium]|nr:hypothetical protein [Cytophagales bacterium]
MTTQTLSLARKTETAYQKLTSSQATVEDVVALRPKRKLRPDQWILRIAASLVILSALSYIVWYYAAPHENQLNVVTRNGVEKIILNDGSLVWLRGESKVLLL